MSQLNQATNDGQLDYRDNEAYFEAAWIFNQDEYSRESFAAEFNEILTERVGENWREHKVNTPIKEKALLETGVKDEENGLPTLYVCCGS